MQSSERDTSKADSFTVPEPPRIREEFPGYLEAVSRSKDEDVFKKRVTGSPEGREMLTEVFDECLRDSFKYASVPMCLGGTSLFYWALTRGYVSTQIPPTPIIVVRCAFIAISGLIVGQALYAATGRCEKKFQRRIEGDARFDKFKQGLPTYPLAPG